jgi:hypothetical protein
MSQLASHLQNFFKPREVLIVGVVLLLILGSLGLFAIMQMPNSVAANVQATSTVHAKAISTAYVATDIARRPLPRFKHEVLPPCKPSPPLPQ